MFIFILATDDMQTITKEFTFHYVYIYIVPLFTIHIHHINLHSTMFIFISIANQTADKFQWHLHSTMFIFICKKDMDDFEEEAIYIPLCLYLYGE